MYFTVTTIQVDTFLWFFSFHGDVAIALRVLPSFTEFYRVTSIIRQFHRVLPGFTEFYRVLPSFVKFHQFRSNFT